MQLATNQNGQVSNSIMTHLMKVGDTWVDQAEVEVSNPSNEVGNQTEDAPESNGDSTDPVDPKSTSSEYPADTPNDQNDAANSEKNELAEQNEQVTAEKLLGVKPEPVEEGEKKDGEPVATVPNIKTINRSMEELPPLYIKHFDLIPDFIIPTVATRSG